MTEDTAVISTPLGGLILTGNASGLISVSYLDDDSYIASEEIPPVLREAAKQLEEYFTGNRKHFCIKILPKGSEFQKRVWDQLQKIPYGTTVSYREMSVRLGDTKLIRAAAAANGKNPLAIIIPCHRVIGSDGSLTGYAGGLHRKKWLLVHENPVKQQMLL